MAANETYTHKITIERKEGGKWLPWAVVTESKQRAAFMAAWCYTCKNCVGDIVATRSTHNSEGARVEYYKTTNTEGGFDFRATIEY